MAADTNTRTALHCMYCDSSNRFPTINREEFAELIKQKDSKNTQAATQCAVNVLRAYLAAKKLPANFEDYRLTTPSQASTCRAYVVSFLHGRRI